MKITDDSTVHSHATGQAGAVDALAIPGAKCLDIGDGLTSRQFRSDPAPRHLVTRPQAFLTNTILRIG